MSEKLWYLASRGETLGPLTHVELVRRIEGGQLARADLVWQDGFPEWVPAGTISGLFRGPPPLPRREAGCDPSANRKMLAQLRADVGDNLLATAESIRVLVRLNPVNLQIHGFLEHINTVTEATSAKKTAQRVKKALAEVDLTEVVGQLDAHQDQFAAVGPEVVGSIVKKLQAGWPQGYPVPHLRWLDDPITEGDLLRQQLHRALGTHRDDLDAIQRYFRQLRKHHPRYHALMTEGNVVDWLIQFGSAILVGEEASKFWGVWSQQNDKEFIRKFGTAVDQFSTTALAFTEKTEQAVEAVITELVRDLNDVYQTVLAALEMLVDTRDLSTIYRHLHYPAADELPDENAREFLELVLSNLRDANLPLLSEANLREMVGLR